MGKTESGELIVKENDGTTKTVSPSDAVKQEEILNIGDKVKAKDGSEGTVVGKTESGELIVKKKDGTTKAVSPSDVVKKKEVLNVGDKVKMKDGSEGKVVGKTESGELIVKKKDGTTKNVSPSDVVKKEKGDLDIGSSVKLPDGTIGKVVKIDDDDGNVTVETEKGRFIYNEHSLIDMGKNQELLDIENELHILNEDLKYNERIISELMMNIRQFKTEKNSIDSEERQKSIALHDRKQKELNFIRQSIALKEKHYEGLKLLIQSEFERNRQLQSNKNAQLLLSEQQKIKSIKKKMKEMTQKNLDKSRSLDETDELMKIDKLKNQTEKRRQRSKKKDRKLRKHQANATVVDDMPIFSTDSKPVKRTRKRTKNKRKNKKEK